MATNKKNVNTSQKTATKTQARGAQTKSSQARGKSSQAQAKSSQAKAQSTQTQARRPQAQGAQGQVVRKRRRRRGVSLSNFIVFMAVVIGLILCAVITMVMRNKYLQVEQVGTEYALGDPFVVTAYIKAVNSNAVVELAEDFEPDNIGTAKIHYVVKCGKLSKTGTVKVEVVDNNYPVISGPDTLCVFENEDISLIDYYYVEDEQPDLTDELKIDKTPDFSTKGITNYTLGVTDWSNNFTSRTITIRVYSTDDYERETRVAAQAVREYNREYGTSVPTSTVRVYFPDEDSDHCYVLVNGAYMFEVGEDGNITTLGEQTDGDETYGAVATYGIVVSISNLSAFNYNAE